MSEHPKQVSLFFEAAHCMSSEVIDNLQFMSSTSVRSTAIMRYWMKKTTNATFGIDKGELVQVAFLQIHCGDGAHLQVLLGSLTGVSLVHFFLICSVLFSNSSGICRTLQAMDNRSGLPVLILSIAMHVSSVQPILSCESRYVESFRKR